MINGQPLERVLQISGGGGYISSNLSWDDHITQICSRAKRQMGVLYGHFYRGLLTYHIETILHFICELC